MSDEQQVNKLPREITARGILIAAVLTVLFTAANTYLGLKVGVTFATSIPAAILSMAVLRAFKGNSMLENNIVQTIVSASACITTMVFVLPAMVILGLWHEFPFWQTFLIGAVGGTLGVLLSVPLRRALVVESDLPYPEGRAAAEVLRVGDRAARNDGDVALGKPLRDLSVAAVFAFVFNLCSGGCKLLSGSVSHFFRFSGMATGIGFQFSFASFGAGYLMGLRIGLSILLGVVLCWGIAVPWLSLHHAAAGSAGDVAMHVWAEKVRFIGAGIFAVASVWIALRLLKPLVAAVRSAMQTAAKRRANMHIDLHERDISLVWVLAGVFLLTLPAMAVIAHFIGALQMSYSAGSVVTLVVVGAFLLLLIGFFIAVAAGYMAGLVGSSYSPISGLIIVAAIILALFFRFMLPHLHVPANVVRHAGDWQHAALALTVFIAAFAVAVASIANDNMQDLKTGHLIGATPWKQQVMLIVGTAIGAAVISPVLGNLYHAYGFVGALPRPHMDVQQALPAPQATLIAALAQSIIGHHMRWNMLLVGVALGLVGIVVNSLLLAPRKLSQISVLSVGFGIYLPAALALPVVAGGLLSWAVKRKLVAGAKYRDTVERCGTLLACGMIVGEALFGIFNSAVIGATGKTNALVLTGKHFEPVALVLGVVLFASAIFGFYRYVKLTRTTLERDS